MPSRSALMAAAARAAHLEVDQPPFIFEDALARRLLGNQADELLSYHHKSGSHPVLMGTRLAVTTRARYAEDRLADAIKRGIEQYVVIGAGLDTFAYRSTLASALMVYEVDEPETSAWKREVLDAAGVALSSGVRFVPGDLARAPLIELLVEAGLDMDRPAFVSWLGVTMYLEHSAIERTVNAVGRMAAETELVFDHVLPAAQRDEAGAEYASFAESVGAASGEPWVTSLTVEEVATMLANAGFELIAQPLLIDWVDRRLWTRNDAIRPSRLWAMSHARVPGP
jgi:methyltransferase (TIGR00027 family)